MAKNKTLLQNFLFLSVLSFWCITKDARNNCISSLGGSLALICLKWARSHENSKETRTSLDDSDATPHNGLIYVPRLIWIVVSHGVSMYKNNKTKSYTINSLYESIKYDCLTSLRKAQGNILNLCSNYCPTMSCI